VSRQRSPSRRGIGALALPRSTPTLPLQAKTRELAGSGDALRAIARFTQRDVRYVAIEIGIGGFQPHAAGEVFSNRFGDCKDKANLLRAMQYAKRAANLFIVRPRVIGQKADKLIDTKRVYAYETDGPSLHTDEVEIRIPPTMKLDELPAKVDIKTPVVQYNSASTFADGVLHYSRRYALQTFSIPRESFTELNAAWKQILGDERASAVFK
jgi:hypothetical protein